MTVPFAERMREARKARGISQAQLAAVVGQGRASCSAWERGKTVPPAETIEQLAAALGISPARLMGWDK